MCPNVNCILDKMVLFVASRVSKASDIYTHRDRSPFKIKKKGKREKMVVNLLRRRRTHDWVLEEGVRKTSFFHQC